MREITIDGDIFEVHPLTRGLLRQMRREGMPLDRLPPDKGEEAMDRALAAALSPEQFAATDEMDNPHCIRLFREILRETFSSPDEEKNSLPSPGGSITPSGGSTAPDAPIGGTAPDATGSFPRPSTPAT